MGSATAEQPRLKKMMLARPEFAQRIETIGREAEAEPESVAGLPSGSGGAAPAVDPFQRLQGVAGWVIDYVAFLRQPIDQLQGDPQNVQATADAIKSAAERMRTLAETHRTTLAQPGGWSGDSHEAFKTSMDTLGQELDSLANAVDKKGTVVATTGAMVQALRDMVVDLVTRFSDSLVPGAITAYVMAPFTFGASIAAFLGSVVSSAVELGTTVAAKMDSLAAALSRQADRLKKLDEISDEVTKGWERFDGVADGTAVASKPMARTELAPARTATQPARRLVAMEAEEVTTAQQASAPLETAQARMMTAREPLQHASQAFQATAPLAPAESTYMRAEEAVQARKPLAHTEATYVRATEQSVQARHVTEPAYMTATEQQVQARQVVAAEPALEARRLSDAD
ncbi:WXG100 family type VII secretion target [Saccharothrix deserti]|uniref:WXG100 family type VII secretion target n=1 Tax=Saccharothrix deserti TaxID=2593674 RepID=UPI00131E627A|nr:WXG100 family type VII secretion target [Saccharothrix deserti]